MKNAAKWVLCAAAILLAVPAFADVEIARAWAGGSPTIDGVIGAGEWSAGTMTTIQHGKLVTMNDGHFLYVFLDVTDDTGNDPPTLMAGDYYALAVDVDQNHAVTPNIDLDYDACQDGRVFVKSYYLSASTFTGCQTVGFGSQGAIGFGATPNSATPHRFWEFKLDFQEIGVDPTTWTTSSGSNPKVRMNVGTHSDNPPFTTAQPDPNIFPDLTNTFQIDLAIGPSYPPGTTGPTFAGVGLVPSSYIDSFGYANINITNYYYAKDAPFGGNLNVFGHWNTLASYPGAKKYRVLYSKDGGPYNHLLQTWTNFQWNGTTWVAKAIGPDSDDSYAIPNPADIWYLTNLLISWQSSLFAEGTYNLKLELLNNGGGVIGAVIPSNSLTLKIDNTPPAVKINSVKYGGSDVCACAIVTQGDPPTGFTFNISATDAEGDLNTYTLYGLTGENVSFGITSDAYDPTHVGADGAYKWNGVSGLNTPSTPWRATTSCAYTFVLAASGRSQNGYGLLFPHVDYHKSLTVILGTGPGVIQGCP
jgi:hypothetical protein